MGGSDPDRYGDVADAAWRWVLDQVRWFDGPWIPESAPATTVPPYRDGMHSGIGGLAHVLAEIRLARPWTNAEQTLAESIAARLVAGISAETDCTYFDGLVSSIGVLSALDVPGAEAAVDRLMELATPQGWPQTALMPPRFLPDTHINDLTLGTAGVLLGAIWARRMGVAKAGLLADYAAGVLLAEREDGVTWSFVPQRYRTEPGIEMPNLSHGLAGIAMALALAGSEFDRADLTAAALAGAEHLVTLGVADGEGFVVRRYIRTTSPTRTSTRTAGATARPAPPCCSSRWTTPV